MDALVNVLAKLGDGGLGDAGHAHGLDEFIDPPGADPADPRFLDHRNQRFLDHLAGLKEARKIGPSTPLGAFQVQRAYPGIQTTEIGRASWWERGWQDDYDLVVR